MPHLTRTIRYDEAYTYIHYARSPLTALFVYTAPNNHLLYSLLVWISTNLVGNSVIGIRLPAFLMGILGFAYQFRLTKRLLGSNHAAFLSMLILAIMPLFADHLVNGRGYSLTVLLTLIYIEFIFFDKICLAETNGRWLLLLTVLLIITLPTMLLLVFAMMLWIIYQAIEKGRYKQLSSYFLSLIFGSMIGTLFYLQGIIAGSASSFSEQFGYATVQSLIFDFGLNLSPPRFQWLVVLALILGIIFAGFKQPDVLKIILCVFIVAIGLAFVQQILTGRVLFPRIYLYIYPLIAMLAAYALSQIINFLPAKQSIAFVLTMLFLAYIPFTLRSFSTATNVDALSAAIDANGQDNDALLIDCCLDFPIYYLHYFLVSYERPEAFARIIVISTGNRSRDALLQENGIPIDLSCSEEMWDSFPVYVCENSVNF